MHFPTLNELPSPPPSKTGWPWTEESPQLPGTMPNGYPWPRVSVVTPSYNQAQFIEETIRSVLLQGYPNLEYIVIDGGSTDGSVEIIRKYADRLAYWVSEPDRGQSHAINKGWKRATGEVVAWLNSDDVYMPGAVRTAVEALAKKPDAAMVYSDGLYIDEVGAVTGAACAEPFDVRRFLLNEGGNPIPQPTAFIRRSVLCQVGFLDEEMYLHMDCDLWVRIGSRWPVICIEGAQLACLRCHSQQKTATLWSRWAVDQKHLLDKFYATDDHPAPLRRLRRRAYACAEFMGAVAAMRIRRPGLIIKGILASLRADPRYSLGRWLDTAYLMKEAVLMLVSVGTKPIGWSQ